MRVRLRGFATDKGESVSRPLVIRTTALVVLYTIALLTYRLSGNPGLFAAAIGLVMLGAAWVSPFALTRFSEPSPGAADADIETLSAIEIELGQLEQQYWQDREQVSAIEDYTGDGEQRG